jgi:hypothetical protein
LSTNTSIFSSFRDPSGIVYKKDKEVFRQINNCYASQYEKAVETGLFEFGINKKLLLPFEEVEPDESQQDNVYKIIKPEQIKFISYPYEWCFSQIKDAALLTLDLHLAALERDMVLKDASIYNVQFWNGRPTFIDHLSFELLENVTVWPAYGQFCRHFLAPLALMAHRDYRLNSLYLTNLDGVPLDLASTLLKKTSNLNPRLLMHIHLHAKAQKRYSVKANDQKIKGRRIDMNGLLGIAGSLRKAVEKLHWKSTGTEWGNYYKDTNYSESSMQAKKAIITSMLEKVEADVVWDLGGNDGTMTCLASERGAYSLCFDIDHAAVEKNYLRCRKEGEKNLLPLVMDFCNPSPGIGFASKERDSLSDRVSAELVMALAFIHHLAISNNLPFKYIAEYFASLGPWLIIEFVPKSDSQVQRLLATREDIFDRYDQENFEVTFGSYYEVVEKTAVSGSERFIYLMKRK